MAINNFLSKKVMRRGRLVVVVILLFCLLQGGLISYHTSSSHADGELKEQLPPPEQPFQSQEQLPNLVQRQQTLNAEAAQSRVSISPLHPAMTDDPCSDEVCMGHLRYGALGSYRFCERLAYLKTLVPSEKVPKQCKFRDGRGRDPVALVSCPGSGNTWVRGLLEKATGICTGSIYCDAPLRNGGFIGESIKDGSVLVIKTHTSDFQWKDTELEERNHGDSLYGSAILLIRNPFDAFISERHRSILLQNADAKLFADQRLYGVGNVRADDASHVDGAIREAFGETKILTTMPKTFKRSRIQYLN